MAPSVPEGCDPAVSGEQLVAALRLARSITVLSSIAGIVLGLALVGIFSLLAAGS